MESYMPTQTREWLTQADLEAAEYVKRKVNARLAEQADTIRYLREIVLSQQGEIEALKAQVRQREEEAAWREHEAARNQPLANVA